MIDKILKSVEVAPPIPCPDTGFSCPGCDECEILTYRIKPDEYVCGVCGLVSTVNECVAHYQELKRGESLEQYDTEAFVRQGAD